MFLRPSCATLQKWVLSNWYIVDSSFYEVIFEISSVIYVISISITIYVMSMFMFIYVIICLYQLYTYFIYCLVSKRQRLIEYYIDLIYFLVWIIVTLAFINNPIIICEII